MLHKFSHKEKKTPTIGFTFVDAKIKIALA
jgi:hypothetical protein